MQATPFAAPFFCQKKQRMMAQTAFFWPVQVLTTRKPASLVGRPAPAYPTLPLCSPGAAATLSDERIP